MFTINLPSRPLLALREIAAKKDVRYYLNGVSLEVGQEGAFLSASNGSILGVARLAECPANVQAKVVIPRTLLDRLKPSALGVVVLTARRDTADAGRWRLELDTLDGCLSDWSVHEWAPDWRRLTPRSPSGVAGQFHQEVLGTLIRASKALHGRSHPPMTIGHNGPGNAALIGFGDPDFFGVAMTMNAEMPDAPPAWIDSRPAYASMDTAAA